MLIPIERSGIQDLTDASSDFDGLKAFSCGPNSKNGRSAIEGKHLEALSLGEVGVNDRGCRISDHERVDAFSSIEGIGDKNCLGRYRDQIISGSTDDCRGPAKAGGLIDDIAVISSVNRFDAGCGSVRVQIHRRGTGELENLDAAHLGKV